ncbi:MAG: YkgJ family cysteine cluster protein [Candidatus Bathyarchaeota archaeon]|nr:YkgJ family cysteine cluster protein [Candidatus Bathyarchaeota archaeon]
MDECTRCGRCCRHLRTGDETTGLTLFPEETHLFPEETVKPHLGKGDSSPTTLFTYQYTENICVHLADNQCMIYDSRPLMCRSFPVKIGEYGLRFSPGCEAVLNSIKGSKKFNREQEEVKAAFEMVRRLYEFHTSFQGEDTRWRYNLVSSEWETY